MSVEAPPADTPGDTADLPASPRGVAQPVAGIDRPTAPPRSADRLQAAGEVVLCSGFPSQLFLILVLALVGLQPLDASGRLSLIYIGTLSMLDALLLITLILTFLRVRGERPRELFCGTRPMGREMLLGLILVPVIIGLAAATLVLIGWLAPWMHNVQENPLESLITGTATAAAFIVVAVVAGGLREELQRAFVLHRFEQHLGGAPLGLVVFSLAFGAGHVLQGWDAAVATAVLGAAWGLLYLARRSVIAAVVSHSAFNVIEIVRHAMTA